MEFRGQYFYLSNFYPSVVYGYPTVEHAYQAAKSKNKAERMKIRSAKTPAEAKRLGRKVKLRHDWEEIKDTVMETLLRRKFLNYPELLIALEETGDIELVESNWWHDNYWGDCRCLRCKKIAGENKLGKLLMKIRYEAQANA